MQQDLPPRFLIIDESAGVGVKIANEQHAVAASDLSMTRIDPRRGNDYVGVLIGADRQALVVTQVRQLVENRWLVHARRYTCLSVIAMTMPVGLTHESLNETSSR